MDKKSRKGIVTNFRNLQSEIRSMKQKPLCFLSLQRKFSPFLKTSRLGDTIMLRLRFTDQGLRITRLPDMDGYSPRVTIYSNNFPDRVIDMTVDTNKELMTKILVKHKLLNVDAYVD